MGDCKDRMTEFDKRLDRLDSIIASAVKERNELLRDMPKEYDSCGEGEVYFRLLPSSQCEAVYHAVAGIDQSPEAVMDGEEWAMLQESLKVALDRDTKAKDFLFRIRQDLLASNSPSDLEAFEDELEELLRGLWPEEFIE